jgi:hypothetical protein
MRRSVGSSANARIVGDRVYRGQVVARDCWPAILDRETFARLQLTLNHPGRRGAPPRHHKRLATGFAQCGLCGQTMSTTTRSGVRSYSCPTQPTGRIHVRADGLEAWLLDRLLEQLGVEPPPTAQDVDPGDSATAMAELAATTTSIASCLAPRSCRPERSWYAVPTNSRGALAVDRRLHGSWRQPIRVSSSLRWSSRSGETCWPIVSTDS